MPEGLSDEKTIQAIQENPYMQYLLGLPKFTEKPVFVPELFVQIRKRLVQGVVFALLTLHVFRRVELRIAFALQSPSLVLREMPVEDVDFVSAQEADFPL